MHIDNSYKVRQVAGENLIVKQGKTHADMTKVISLNSSALVLWNELQGKEFTQADAAGVLVAHFGIAQEQADTDAGRWIDSLMHCDVIVE